MSDQVSRLFFPSRLVPPYPANEASVSKPHDARIPVLNGTRTWCVTSCTESITPPAPQCTVKSAARATPGVMVSKSRWGTLPAVEYPCTWKMVSTPGRAPALRLMLVNPPVTPSVHEPTLGVHTISFGFGVFSFAAPAHQRGPFSEEFAGLVFAWPRPHAVIRHAPGRLSPVLPQMGNVESPPYTRALLSTANSAG